MNRFLLFILLFASTARANYWTRTNDINGISLNPASLTGTVGAVRYTTYATDGGPAKDLGGLIAWGEITDLADDYRRQTEGVVLSATGGVAIAIDSLAAGTYTWRIMAGSSTNDNIAFPIAWETIVVTNPPSAGGGGSVTVVVSNQHMASLRSDGASTGLVAVSRADGGADLLPWGGDGSGGGGDMTEISNRVSAVEGYTNRAATALQAESDPVYGASEWSTNTAAAIIAASSSGGSGGTVQLNTNGNGQIIYTNADGYAEGIRETVLPAGIAPTIIRHYNGSETLSNLNASGSVTITLTNGLMIGMFSPETAGVRAYGYEAVSSGLIFRAAWRIPAHGHRSLNGSAGQTLCGPMWQRYDGTNYQWAIRQNGANPATLLVVQYAANYAYSILPIPGVPPYATDALTVNLTSYAGGQEWMGIDYDGVAMVRCFLGADPDALQLLHVMTNTLVTTPAIKGVAYGYCSLSAGAGATNHYFAVDTFIYEEGKRWLE